MTPDQELKLNELYDFMQALKASATIPYDVDSAFRDRLTNSLTLPNGFENAPLSAIGSPSGGAVVDAQCRQAVNSIITTLQSLGLTL